MMAGFLLMIFFFFFTAAGFAIAGSADSSYESILGDNEIKNPDARFALEAWNACNEVGDEAAPTGMGSPRIADCADLNCTEHGLGKCIVIQKVKDSDNSLKAGDGFPKDPYLPPTDVEDYAEGKEIYLSSLCKRLDNDITWYFWKIMVKNGNLNASEGKCPENGRKVSKVNQTLWSTQFPCFGPGCMNQPLMYRNASRLVDADGINSSSLTGAFYGTYDVNNDTVSSNGTKIGANNSYFAVSWQETNKTNKNSSWEVTFTLRTSPNYPWLKLLQRADAVSGTNAGYPHIGRGIMNDWSLQLLQGNFTVRLTLNITKGGGVGSQFYLTEIGGCLRNNGNPCDDRNATTDVTRYVQMIINPETNSICGYDNQVACPPYHVNRTGHKIYKNDSVNFPYDAYHLYCATGNAQHLEEPINKCDPYTNPNAQELMQLLPHPEWHVHGYPNSTNDVGWEEGDPKIFGNSMLGAY